jgi:hypothetical protein
VVMLSVGGQQEGPCSTSSKEDANEKTKPYSSPLLTGVAVPVQFLLIEQVVVHEGTKTNIPERSWLIHSPYAKEYDCS